ncbi:phage virion morphogenesis protein [Thiomicrorhabdus indica]|uniref:phage virion morphogenesis protein n=1 Tax=Thiomicrorhabdus indica TaxID=2267253 RepID=UPI002AA7B0F0|nr:phage virion morphogenesis protein [Thiomicrorhabdus indica]
MAGIKINVDDKEVRKALDRLADPDLIKEALGGIGEVLVENTRDRIKQGIDVDGNPFTPLAPITQQLKKKNKDKPLVHDGYLLASLAYQLVNGGTGLEYGSDLPYAALQHFGGTIRPKNAKMLQFGKGSGIFAKESHIPARPFIGLTQQDEDEILDNLAHFIDNQLK